MDELEQFATETEVSNAINALIQDEWQAIEGYKTTILEFSNIPDTENIIKVLNDIMEEEMVHVGELQACLGVKDDSVENIEDGEEEASEMLEEE